MRSAGSYRKRSTKAKRPTAARPRRVPRNIETLRAKKLLDAFTSAWPPLSDAQRAAFAARYSDAQCEEIGKRTKSDGVLRDALAWLPAMAKTLQKSPEAVRRYGQERFVWLLECVRALASERACQLADAAGDDIWRAKAADAEGVARAARSELLATLVELADGNPAAQEALHAASGTADRPEQVVSSLLALGDIGRYWLSQAHSAAEVLVESVGLTLAEVKAAEAAAEALAEACSDRDDEGRVVLRDAPFVNRAEGRVLLEMQAAMRVFGYARERNKQITKLTPGPATRAALTAATP
jgi:hypothetical protein